MPPRPRILAGWGGVISPQFFNIRSSFLYPVIRVRVRAPLVHAVEFNVVAEDIGVNTSGCGVMRTFCSGGCVG